MKTTLSRRKLLRGSLAGGAVSIALPRLSAMLNGNGDGYANGAELPRRFGVWATANGVIPDKWIPTDTGPSYTLSPALQPLAPVRDWFSVITGLSGGFGFRPHAAVHTSFITGASMLGTNDDNYTAARDSLDQQVADLITTKTRFRSLEIGIDQAFPPERGSAFHWWSHRGPNSPNPCTYDCAALFQRLFSDFKPGQTQGMQEPEAAVIARKLRKSILDAVLDDAKDLQSKLGQEDRQRLDSHLESVRRIEQRISTAGETVAAGPGCKMPTAPAMKLESAASDYDIRGPLVNRTMTELLGIAMACDLTRVFTFQFLQPGSRFRSSRLGVTDEFHIRTHNPSQADKVNEIVTYINGELRTFIEVLRDIPEGGGSLLDNCAIAALNDCSYGVDHRGSDYPILMIGRGGGKLRTGTHFRGASTRRGFEAMLSMARTVVPNMEGFGDKSARVINGATEIEM